MKISNEELIKNATVLFWKKGYSAVGMRELQTALDMRPGSIYHRFKSKDGLFRLVIETYVEDSKSDIEACSAFPDALAELERYFVSVTTCPGELQYQRQCLLVRTLSDMEQLPEAIRQVVVDGMATLKSAFLLVLENAQQQGNISQEADLNELAAWLQCQFVGLRTQAFVCEDDEQTKRLISRAMSELNNAA